jgi:hypothetical protein
MSEKSSTIVIDVDQTSQWSLVVPVKMSRAECGHTSCCMIPTSILTKRDMHIVPLVKKCKVGPVNKQVD